MNSRRRSWRSGAKSGVAVIRLVTLGSVVWGLLTSVAEWAFRPPVILEPIDLAGRQPFVPTGGTEGIEPLLRGRLLAAEAG